MRWSPWRSRNYFNQIHRHSNQYPNNFFWPLVHDWPIVVKASLSRAYYGVYFCHQGNSESSYFLPVTMGLFKFLKQKHNKHPPTRKDSRNAQLKKFTKFEIVLSWFKYQQNVRYCELHGKVYFTQNMNVDNSVIC